MSKKNSGYAVQMSDVEGIGMGGGEKRPVDICFAEGLRGRVGGGDKTANTVSTGECSIFEITR